MNLIGDIGGTYARFALCDSGEYTAPAKLERVQFATFRNAIQSYLTSAGVQTIDRAVFAWASASIGKVIDLGWPPTWKTELKELKQQLGLRQLSIINDIVAIAFGIHSGGVLKVQTLNTRKRLPAANSIMISPGTGFGVALAVYADGKCSFMPSDAGFSPIPYATTGRERMVLECMERHLGHLTLSKLICGPGLQNIHACIQNADDIKPTVRLSTEIVAAALSGQDAIAVETVELFLSFLWRSLEGLALTMRAHGGVYLAGSILNHLEPLLVASMPKHLTKLGSRFPVYLITDEYPAFAGLKIILDNTASAVAS
jgi:glucokinase